MSNLMFVLAFKDAYYGQNNKIRETLNNLILKAPQEWHTQVALPFVKIVGTNVEWDEIRFDVRLLQRVPYEGISRMSTSLRRRHRDRVVRRGIGLTIESDFYATEAGRAHFADQLTSIRYCVQETCNFDAIFAYLTCGNYDFRCKHRSRTPHLNSQSCAHTYTACCFHRRHPEGPPPAPLGPHGHGQRN